VRFVIAPAARTLLIHRIEALPDSEQDATAQAHSGHE
jgi:hypothetical protein